MFSPNETCHQGFIGFDIFLDLLKISSVLSNSIYIIGILALKLKCPETFRKYQTLLLIHTISNMFFENYLTIIWKFMLTPPWMSLCGFGLMFNYPAMSVGFFLVFLLSNAQTIIVLLEYRMKSVASFIPQKTLKISKALNYFYSLTQLLVFFSFIYSYEDFEDQRDYKLKIDKTDGPLPNFIFCDNCIVFNLDSSKTILFAISATFSTAIAASAQNLMSFASSHAISSNSSIFSSRTLVVQKSFLRSLFIQLGVHVLFLATPLLIFFGAFLLRLSMEKWQIFMHFLTICFYQHGSFSTLAMLLTNKQLKRSLKLFIKKLQRKLKLNSKTESGHNLQMTTTSLHIISKM
ncbi:unnamed protein product [Caenorhabditis angaria]|uniref:Serpentine Receptor, class H n=1 Tax=Caenorhabditis angaria TaxID=860376 RepID=A0A9P1N624_9PELO|nr:unnamed protein product [Caenorhabditis angaria]